MRARHLVFHIRCFSCAVCTTPLTKGDQFGMRDSTVFCRHHFELQLDHGPAATPTPQLSLSCQYTAAGVAAFGASPNSGPSSSPGASEASLKASGGGGGGNGGVGGAGSAVGIGIGGSGNGSGSGGSAVGGNVIGVGGPPGSSNGAGSGMGSGSGLIGGPSPHGSAGGPVPMGFFGASTPHHPGIAGGLPQAPRQKGRPRKRKPKDIEAMTSNLGESSLRLSIGGLCACGPIDLYMHMRRLVGQLREACWSLNDRSVMLHKTARNRATQAFRVDCMGQLFDERTALAAQCLSVTMTAVR